MSDVTAKTATHRISGTGDLIAVLVPTPVWWLVRDCKQRARWVHRDAVKPRQRTVPIECAAPPPARRFQLHVVRHS